MDTKEKEEIINKTMLKIYENDRKGIEEKVMCPFCNTEIEYVYSLAVSIYKCQIKDCFYKALRGL